MSRVFYLDNNATTTPAEQVVDQVRRVLQTQWANASSVHRAGQLARRELELARHQVAQFIGARDRQILFTSGGTESNNLALLGSLTAGYAQGPLPGANLVTSRLEHAAIREPAQSLEQAGCPVHWVPLDPLGRIDLAALTCLVQQAGDQAANQLTHTDAEAPRPAPVLISLHWVNNETGVIQPVQQVGTAIADLREQLRKQGKRVRLIYHVDATQAGGKLPIDVKHVGCDLLTLASHKFHGPKGCGILFVKQEARLRPMNLGGPQERDRRGGTENLPAIVGMAKACELAQPFLADPAQQDTLAQHRNRFEAAVTDALPGTVVHSRPSHVSQDQPDPRIWNTTNLGFAHLEAEAILLALSERGVCASAGAACSSGSLEPSPVLLAMGVPEPIAHGSVRFSLSRMTQLDELEQAAPIVIDVVNKLRKTLPPQSPR